MKSINTKEIRFTDISSVALKKYLKDVDGYPLLNKTDKDEEHKLFIRYNAGELNLKEILINSNLRFVISVAKHSFINTLDERIFTLNDLIQEGNRGLIYAVEHYDTTRGFRFISYAVICIRGFILRFISVNNYALTVAGNSRKKYNSLVKENAAEYGELSFEEFLNTKKLTEPMYIHRMDIFRNYNIVIVKLLNDIPDYYSKYDNEYDRSEDEIADMREIDYVACEDENLQADYNFENESLKYDIGIALLMFKQKEFDIIRLFYGLGDVREHTCLEIGIIVDLTEERTRQILMQSMKKMRHSYFNKGLIKYVDWMFMDYKPKPIEKKQRKIKKEILNVDYMNSINGWRL